MPIKINDPLKLFKRFKGLKVGVFIDEANLFYIQKEIGWSVDQTKIKSVVF